MPASKSKLFFPGQEMKAVSVIIPVYKSSSKLERTLHTMAAQKPGGRVLQILVANDGADAAVTAVCRSHGVSMVAIAPRRGSYFARNRALEKAAGELIVFVDAGILLPEDWLAKAIQVIGSADYLAGELDRKSLEEVRGHLAMAYDKAGKKREARDLMVELMTTMEDPEMHTGIDRLTRDLGEDPTAIFARIDQTTVAMTFRANVTFTPTLSLQVYGQPFVSAGRYSSFKRTSATPRAAAYADRWDVFGADRLIRTTDGDVAVDFDRDGTADVDLGNPNFTVTSFRSNVVLRWEYRAGSTLFLVWQQNRNGYASDGRFTVDGAARSLVGTMPENTFLVKLNYWLSL